MRSRPPLTSDDDRPAAAALRGLLEPQEPLRCPRATRVPWGWTTPARDARRRAAGHRLHRGHPLGGAHAARHARVPVRVHPARARPAALSRPALSSSRSGGPRGWPEASSRSSPCRNRTRRRCSTASATSTRKSGGASAKRRRGIRCSPSSSRRRSRSTARVRPRSPAADHRGAEERLDRLEPTERIVLEHASVVGREVRANMLLRSRPSRCTARSERTSSR